MAKYLKIIFPILISLYIISRFIKTASDYKRSASKKFSYGDFKGAIQDYNYAIDLDSTNGQTYFDRGILRDHIGDKLGACKDWEKARKLGFKKAFDDNILKYCE
jgi:Flp pilus assembly protein TadD